jgi:hypothetical protein
MVSVAPPACIKYRLSSNHLPRSSIINHHRIFVIARHRRPPALWQTSVRARLHAIGRCARLPLSQIKAN